MRMRRYEEVPGSIVTRTNVGVARESRFLPTRSGSAIASRGMTFLDFALNRGTVCGALMVSSAVLLSSMLLFAGGADAASTTKHTKKPSHGALVQSGLDMLE